MNLHGPGSTPGDDANEDASGTSGGGAVAQASDAGAAPTPESLLARRPEKRNEREAALRATLRGRRGDALGA
ncbi:hypothetical protein ACFJIX_24415 [Roseateles sp. UC29_93]|uniref:hypothetical protein n=1 Tax=Roseateles sp. UC29_93 TaxID=3350177 RepID=UPI00366F4F77